MVGRRQSQYSPVVTADTFSLVWKGPCVWYSQPSRQVLHRGTGGEREPLNVGGLIELLASWPCRDVLARGLKYSRLHCKFRIHHPCVQVLLNSGGDTAEGCMEIRDIVNYEFPGVNYLA